MFNWRNRRHQQKEISLIAECVSFSREGGRISEPLFFWYPFPSFSGRCCRHRRRHAWHRYSEIVCCGWSQFLSYIGWYFTCLMMSLQVSEGQRWVSMLEFRTWWWPNDKWQQQQCHLWGKLHGRNLSTTRMTPFQFHQLWVQGQNQGNACYFTISLFVVVYLPSSDLLRALWHCKGTRTRGS
jgi:hypothetical protein